MKKTKFWGLASILAAGALLFGLTGCDTGNDEYVPEVPTTFYSYATSGNGAVTAKWTFATDKSSIGGAETSWAGKEIAPDAGTGAKIVGGDPCVIKYVLDSTKTDDYGESAGRIQAANKTASLSSLAGASLILTTDAQTNITVRAKGAGAATSARIFVITDAEGEYLVYKDNLYSAGSKFIEFHVQGAPAGTYTIWFNGSTISEIDCNATGNDVSEPKAYSSNDDLTLTAAPTTVLESLIDTHTFTLKDASNTDVTADAVWTLIEGSDIATVKAGVVAAKSEASAGKVKVRARIGMFYKDSDEFEFKACEKGLAMTLIASNMPAKDTKIENWNTDVEAGADAKKVLSTGTKGLDLVEMVDEVATITIAEPLQNIHVKQVGNYALASGVYTLTADNDDKPASEFWSIKDVTGQNGGLAVKDDSTSATTKPSWATTAVSGDNSKIAAGSYENDTELFSISYKIKAAEGKSPKIAGINGCINGGKGAGNIYVDLYMGNTKLGRAFCTKNQSVSATTTEGFTTTAISSGEVTLTFKVGVVAATEKSDGSAQATGKAGQSVQIMNLAAVVVE